MDTTFLTLGLALIGIGLLLLLIDLFIASGALAILALGTIVVGLVFVFRYDPAAGLITAGCVIVGVPAGAVVLLRFFPVLGAWRRGQEPVADTVESMAGYKELTHLKGRYGKTISALRPAGVVDFEGRRIDSLTEGMMVEPGQWVRCVDVKMGKVIVRPVAGPGRPEDPLETMEFD
jgi:membrane-bound ClpP family serine protease